METITDMKSTTTLFDRAYSQFNLVTTISYEFSPVCLSGTWLVFHIAVAAAETHHPPPHCAHNPLLVSISIHQVLMNVNGHHFFSAWKNSTIYFCFLRTSISDAILSDCPSAAIWHTATMGKGTLLGRFSLYCHTTSIHLWCCGLV